MARFGITELLIVGFVLVFVIGVPVALIFAFKQKS